MGKTHTGKMYMENKERKTAEISAAGILAARGMAALLLASLMFVGCGDQGSSSSWPQDDASRKEFAARALEYEYGEEFTVHRVVYHSPGLFVECSPKNRGEVVFEARIRGSRICQGETIGNIWNSSYAEGVAAAQISGELEEEMQEFFPGCYVHTVILAPGGGTRMDNIPELTLEEYLKHQTTDSDGEYDPKYLENGNLSLLVQVHARKDAMGESDMEAEYRYFSEEILGSVAAEEFPETVIWFYLTDDETIEWCREYFKENCRGWQDYYAKLDGSEKLCLKCHFNRDFHWTYEEYQKLWQEKGRGTWAR